MLNKSNSRKVNVLKIGIILPLLALFLWSFNVKEIITYKTIPVAEKPTEKPSTNAIPVAENSEKKGNVAQKNETPSITEASSKPEIKNSQEEKEIREKFSVKITKNTSNAEFENIKKELKEKYGIDLSYSVIRNNSNEITSLAMNYTSTDSRHGNFHETDEEGIEEFYFTIDETGIIEIWSEAAEERRVERMERRTKEMKERKEEMEVRREEMKERRKELDKRREKMEERREKQIAVIDEERRELADRKRAMTYSIANSRGGSNSNVAVISGSDDSVVINKNTSDAELSKMKTELASKNIDFTYKNVKRNDAGEIVAIKISVDDNKGSKSTSVIKGDDDEPIDLIIIHQ